METLSHAPDRVVFGAGAERAVPALLAELGARRVLLIAQERHAEGAERVAAALGGLSAGVFTTDRPQVPADVADAATARARETGADWVLAHGGGTPIGVAKAVALTLPVRVAAVPTTYAGSERTNVWGVVRDGRKTTGRDDRVRPSLVVYDPELTLGLERAVSLDSLFNALAHSVEALYAADATDDARRAARDSLLPLLDGLRAIALSPAELAGRERALRGAALASLALGGAAMGLHHKLAHVLGGSYDTPHARTHATLLPYTLGFNASHAPGAVQALRDAWGADDPPAFLYDLQRSFGLATSLRALGIRQDQLEAIADEALASRYANPRPLEREALVQLLNDALHDRRPSLRTRYEPLPPGATGPHAAMRVTVRGAPLERARVAILGLHGRGACGDRFAWDLERRLLDRDDVAYYAPQARDNTWTPKGYLAPPEENQPWLDSALSVVEASYRMLEARLGAERVIVAGFSQGACLALTWLSQTPSRPKRVLAFTGAPTPLPDADFAAARGAEVHLGSAGEDPWIAAQQRDAAASRLREAGAVLSYAVVPGSAHELHAPDESALRSAVDRAGTGPGRA